MRLGGKLGVARTSSYKGASAQARQPDSGIHPAFRGPLVVSLAEGCARWAQRRSSLSTTSLGRPAESRRPPPARRSRIKEIMARKALAYSSHLRARLRAGSCVGPPACASCQPQSQFAAHFVGEQAIRCSRAASRVSCGHPPEQAIHDSRSFRTLCEGIRARRAPTLWCGLRPFTPLHNSKFSSRSLSLSGSRSRCLVIARGWLIHRTSGRRSTGSPGRTPAPCSSRAILRHPPPASPRKDLHPCTPIAARNRAWCCRDDRTELEKPGSKASMVARHPYYTRKSRELS